MITLKSFTDGDSIIPITSDVCVNVDVGCHSHSVAIGLRDGQLLDEFDQEHHPEGYKLFFQRIDEYQRRYGGSVSVAIEGYNGWARHYANSMVDPD